MSIIEQAIEHYQSQERLVISVPEWSSADNPLQIYVFPMTMAEVNLIQKIARKNASNIEHAANIIIVKARDKNGNRLFKLEDRDALMQKVDYRVVSKIAESIEARFFGSVEEQKGN
jgi:hypothetical protein